MAQPGLGVVFAGYRIEGVAGRGGMGVVYRATDLALDRVVAVKVIAEGLLGDERARARFIRESRIAAAIEHPHVIPIHAAGEHEGTAYIVMRLVRGEDLAARLARAVRLPPAEAVRLLAQVAAALDAAHDVGLVHRDVKPGNVLLDVGDHVYLTDFGVARLAVSAPGVTATGAWVGTLDYVSPEQLRGDAVDARADVYALGCLLHRLLTGDVPFPRPAPEARLWAHLHAVPPRPSALVPGLPRVLDDVVARALAKDREDRPSRAGDLAAAAQAALGGAPAARPLVRAPRHRRRTRPVPTTIADAPPSRRARRRGAAAGAGASLVAVVAAVVALDGRSPEAPRARAGPGPPRVAGAVRVADRPAPLALAGDAVWVGAAALLQHVDREALRVRRGTPGVAGAADLAVRRGEVWAAVPEGRRVLRLAQDAIRASPRTVRLAREPARIAVGEGSVWVAEQDRSGGPAALVEIDPRAHRVVRRLAVPEGINDVRAGLGAVWVVLRTEPVLLKLHPRTLRVLDRVQVGDKPLRIDLGAGSVWVTNHDDDSVSRVDPRSGEPVLIAVPRKPYGIAVRGRWAWVVCFADSTLVRIDTASNRLAGRPLAVGVNPVDVVAGDRSVWVSSRGEDTVTRVDFDAG